MKLFGVTVVLVVIAFFFGPPLSFPTGKMVEIKEGDLVAHVLREQNVIYSETLFSLAAKLSGTESRLQAGRYLFESPIPLWAVISRLAKGEYGTKQIKITVPEGYTNKQIGELFGFVFDDNDQGYLFPDTYYFDQFATESEIKEQMKDNFIKKAWPYSHDHQVVVMASILEKEVQTKEDMELVAGILWKRLEIDMPLQVDAAPVSYEERGLPASPIANPGLVALHAALNPVTSNYLYYLSAPDGKTHYARTFEEHIANQRKYL